MNSKQLLPRRDRTLSRRRFLKSNAVATSTFIGALALGLPAKADVGIVRKLALIGCGRRGRALAAHALEADPQLQLVTVADAFADPIETALNSLANRFPSQVAVETLDKYTGLEAYLHAISKADIAILAAPSGFLPSHLEQAIAQGKHALAESPIATDAPGVRRLLKLASSADQQGIRVAVINSLREHPGALETLTRVRAGDIGNIVSAHVQVLDGPAWVHPRTPGETELVHQVRNWPHFAWLSGDSCLSQLVSNMELVNWMLNNHPVGCSGMGGRQVMTGRSFGETFDHASIEYEYPNGIRVFAHSRQIPGCWNQELTRFLGTQGVGNLTSHEISGPKAWHYEGVSANPVATLVARFLDAVETGIAWNDLPSAANAALTCIMGRMSAYTGKSVTWEQVLNSTTNLSPSSLDWNGTPATKPGPDGFYPSPIPGVTTIA